MWQVGGRGATSCPFSRSDSNASGFQQAICMDLLGPRRLAWVLECPKDLTKVYLKKPFSFLCPFRESIQARHHLDQKEKFLFYYFGQKAYGDNISPSNLSNLILLTLICKG